MSRRSPAPEDRKRDPDRTREKILAAAVEEFSEHGFAGARVNSIAKRAGVNQQLISYYFDGKAGLYEALTHRWRESSQELRPLDTPVAEVVSSFVADTPELRQWARLLAWEGLTGAADDGSDFFAGMVAEIKQRQANGELSKNFDSGYLALIVFAATLAPVTLPHVASAMTGRAADAPEFVAEFRAQLRLLLERMR